MCVPRGVCPRTRLCTQLSLTSTTEATEPKHMARVLELASPMRPRWTRGTGISLGSRVLSSTITTGQSSIVLGDVFHASWVLLEPLVSTCSGISILFRSADSNNIAVISFCALLEFPARSPPRRQELFNKLAFTTGISRYKDATRKGRCSQEEGTGGS